MFNSYYNLIDINYKLNPIKTFIHDYDNFTLSIPLWRANRLSLFRGTAFFVLFFLSVTVKKIFVLIRIHRSNKFKKNFYYSYIRIPLNGTENTFFEFFDFFPEFKMYKALYGCLLFFRGNRFAQLFSVTYTKVTFTIFTYKLLSFTPLFIEWPKSPDYI